MDYLTFNLKMGVHEDVALQLNDLWLRLGLSYIVLSGRRFPLRELEKE